MPLPRGTRIDGELTYDNSADNLRNPSNPPKRVRWGEQSLDEMGSLILSVVPKNPADLEAIRISTLLYTLTPPPQVGNKPLFISSGMVDGASGQPGAVTPGKIVVLYGTRLGPSNLTTAQIAADGRVANDLAGAQVLFDGQPAPLLYASSEQLAAVVPYSVDGKRGTQVTVRNGANVSDPIALPVAPAGPSIFSVDYTGSGQGAIVTEDGDGEFVERSRGEGVDRPRSMRPGRGRVAPRRGEHLDLDRAHQVHEEPLHPVAAFAPPREGRRPRHLPLHAVGQRAQDARQVSASEGLVNPRHDLFAHRSMLPSSTYVRFTTLDSGYRIFMPNQPFRDAERKQLSMLAAVEKKTLIWLAHRMPAWVNSDHLTLLGFVAMFVAGLCYWAASWDRRALIGVILALAVNWFGDSLDGTLARVRNRLRPRYGFYVDHITDAIGTFFLIGGLGLSGYMSPNIALGLLIAYFLLSIEVYLTTYTIGTFHLSFWSFGPTELRVLLCIGNIALFYRPEVTLLGRRFLLFDIGGAVGIAGMALMLVWSALRHTRQLYEAERLP